jgi:hypothetical protein
MESIELQEIRKLEKKFDDHILEDREYMRGMRDELSKAWNAIGARVTWSWLWTIVIFCVVSVGGMMRMLYTEIKDTNVELRETRLEIRAYNEKQSEKSANIQSDISQIKGEISGGVERKY